MVDANRRCRKDGEGRCPCCEVGATMSACCSASGFEGTRERGMAVQRQAFSGTVRSVGRAWRR